MFGNAINIPISGNGAMKNRLIDIIALALRWVVTTVIAACILFFLAAWLIVTEDMTAWQVVGLWVCAGFVGLLEVFRELRSRSKKREFSMEDDDSL